jgi:hypothetical protein
MRIERIRRNHFLLITARYAGKWSATINTLENPPRGDFLFGGSKEFIHKKHVSNKKALTTVTM